MNLKTLLVISAAAILALGLGSCASNPQKASQKSYSKGKSEYIAENYNMSFQEIQKAAQAGDPDAEYALGYMFYYGKGTPQNVDQAKTWMRKASAQGQPQATKALELIGETQQANMASATMKSAGKNINQAIQKTNTAHLHPAKHQNTSNPPKQPNQTVSNNTQKLVPGSPKPEPSALAKGYTIQLLGSHHQKDIINFMKRNNLEKQTAYYKTTYQGQEWYVLVYGHFQSSSQAKAAIKALPAVMQRNNPWVKSFASVRAGIEQGSSHG